MDSATTHVACLTPPGRGAIAVLAIRGPRAWEVTRLLFEPAQTQPLPELPPPGRCWFGRLGAELRDEVVVAVRQDDPPGIEVHCHGGPEVVRLLLETYEGHGVAPCTWQRLMQQEPAGASQQQVLPWLVRAPTTRTAAILLDQYRGAFERKLADVAAALGGADTGRVLTELARLADLAPLGRHLVQPWRVVVAGAPNVGKSSLVNALAGYTRCLVSEAPGTTRDLVVTTLAIDGWPVELIDTAGQRAATEVLEQAGIERARRAGASADLRLWVLDASVSPILPQQPAEWQLVINKIDLAAEWDLSQFGAALRVSAATKAGLAELCQAMAALLVPIVPAAGEAVPPTPEAAELAQALHERAVAGKHDEVRALLGARD